MWLYPRFLQALRVKEPMMLIFGERVPGRRNSRHKVLTEKQVWHVRGKTESLAYLEQSKKGGK